MTGPSTTPKDQPFTPIEAQAILAAFTTGTFAETDPQAAVRRAHAVLAANGFDLVPTALVGALLIEASVWADDVTGEVARLAAVHGVQVELPAGDPATCLALVRRLSERCTGLEDRLSLLHDLAVVEPWGCPDQCAAVTVPIVPFADQVQVWA